MNDYLDNQIDLAQLALKQAEDEHGLHSVAVANQLEKLALLLRERKRILDAVNSEARADIIWNNNPSEPRPRAKKILSPKADERSKSAISFASTEISRSASESLKQDQGFEPLSEKIRNSEAYRTLLDELTQSLPNRKKLVNALDTLASKISIENKPTSALIKRWSHTVGGSHDLGPFYYASNLGKMRVAFVKNGVLEQTTNVRCAICMSEVGSERLCEGCKPHCYVCSACGTIGRPVTFSKFNMLVAVILFLCFLLPWLIYLFWCYFTNYDGCSKCKGKTLIPANSFSAKKLLVIENRAETAQLKISSELKACPFCAEEIKLEAIKCKHCQSNLSAS